MFAFCFSFFLPEFDYFLVFHCGSFLCCAAGLPLCILCHFLGCLSSCAGVFFGFFLVCFLIRGGWPVAGHRWRVSSGVVVWPGVVWPSPGLGVCCGVVVWVGVFLWLCGACVAFRFFVRWVRLGLPYLFEQVFDWGRLDHPDRCFWVFPQMGFWWFFP